MPTPNVMRSKVSAAVGGFALREEPTTRPGAWASASALRLREPILIFDFVAACSAAAAAAVAVAPVPVPVDERSDKLAMLKATSRAD